MIIPDFGRGGDIQLHWQKASSFVGVAILAAMILNSLFDSAASVVTRSETKEYRAFPGDLMCNFAGSGNNLGGACFQVQANEKTSGFTVNDEHLGPVFAVYEWRNSGGVRLGWGTACGSASNLVIPVSSTRLTVQVNILGGPSPLSCGLATEGSITATFTQ